MCHAHRTTFLFFAAILDIQILSNSDSSQQYNLLFDTLFAFAGAEGVKLLHYYAPAYPTGRGSEIVPEIVPGIQSGNNQHRAGANTRYRTNQYKPIQSRSAAHSIRYQIQSRSAYNRAGAAAERKLGAVAADRTGLHTTDFLSCYNMTV